MTAFFRKPVAGIYCLLALLSALLFNSCGKQENPQAVEIHGKTMGTTFQVKYLPLPSDDDQRPEAIGGEINAALIAFNQLVSTYIKDSRISSFNQFADTTWFPVDSTFLHILEGAREINRLSGGAMDITVGPLVNLWGFGPGSPEQRHIPEAAAIAAAKANTGMEKLEIRHDPPAVRKQIPGLYIDLSSIAKGYGVDLVGRLLEKKGYANYLVEIGGEVRTRGVNERGVVWRLGISSPEISGGLQAVIALDNFSMATSGDYMNYFEENGVRYSHLIDPVAAKPISHNLASVTVLHPSCMMADGFATAINVLGPEQGMALAERENLPIMMIIREGEGFVEKMNDAFRLIREKTEESGN